MQLIITYCAHEEQKRKRHEFPSITAGTLSQIASKNETSNIVLDEYFLGSQDFNYNLHHHIKKALKNNEKIAISFSITNDTAEHALEIMRMLKEKYGNKITTLLGGMQVNLMPEAFTQNTINGKLPADVIGIGDGEKILPEILNDIENNNLQKIYKGQTNTNDKEFASYDNFIHPKVISWYPNKLIEITKWTQNLFNQEFDFRFPHIPNLTVEGYYAGNCTWKELNGEPCSFCLDRETRKKNISLEEYIEYEAELVKKNHPRVIADKAPNFMPIRQKEQREYLERYIELMNQHQYRVPRQVSSNLISIHEENIDLYKKAWIYGFSFGVESFNEKILKQQNKPQKNKTHIYKTFDILEQNQIWFNCQTIIGSINESEETLDEMKTELQYIAGNYKYCDLLSPTLLSLYPGTKDYQEYEQTYPENEYWKKYQENGYLSIPDMNKLSLEYMQECNKNNLNPEYLMQYFRENLKIR